MKKPVEIILDSGAFSAWNRGRSIDIDSYIRFIKQYSKFITHCVNLDCIPSVPNVVPTAQQVEESASKGWDNLKYMESKGVPSIPVFHQHESLKWLKKMIDEGYSYIGISPANDRTTQQKREWLDEIFLYISDNKGVPYIKTHAFGVTSTTLMQRYPWYTVDSASWAILGAWGKIYFPASIENGAYDYAKTPLMLRVTEKGLTEETFSEHYLGITEDLRKKCDEYLESLGVSYEQVRDDHYSRTQVNISFFLGYEKQVQNLTPSKFDRSLASKGFFDPPSLYGGEESKNNFGPMSIYFATSLYKKRNAILQSLKCSKWLLSFIHFQEGKKPKDYTPDFEAMTIEV